ncbi:MAG TPA: dephospho-CoA kinase [Clostridiales bacterium]|nr:dephospho-CoA kinase [Clostridiales bacterium]
MKVIGLTGGIASGKSTVSSMLKQLGAYIIDADVIAREVYEDDRRVVNRLVKTFGPDIIDGEGNVIRSKLAERVFGNAEALKVLNYITHPVIIDRIISEIDNIKKATHPFPAIIVDAALLIECGLYKYVDRIWLVKTDRNQQIKRLMVRDNISREQAINRINSQMPDEEKERFAHRIINNNGDLSNLRRQVQNLWRADVLGGGI